MLSAEFSALPKSSPAPPATKALRVHSCVLCQQRKVKCDRKNPCSGCVKAGVECVSSAPAPPRRRKRKLPDVDLHAKLKRYEELLKSYGAKFEDFDPRDASREMEYQFTEEATYPFRRRSIQSASTRKDSSPGTESGRPSVDQGMRFLDK
jgi:Fungal Zn(2)-Cys(6) binuclear cluster domain